MILARQRTDLIDDGLLIPYNVPVKSFGEKTGKTITRFITLYHWVEGTQDDEGKGEFATDFGVFQTIDLDFKEIK